MNKISLLITLLFILSGCQNLNSRSSKTTQVNNHIQSLSKEDKAKYFKVLADAQISIRNFRYDLAASQLLRASVLSKSSPLAQQAIFMAERSEDTLTSYQISKSWIKFAPKNQIAYAWKAIGEIRSHQNKKAQQTLEVLLKLTSMSENHDFVGISEQIIKMTTNQASLINFKKLASSHPNNPYIPVVLARIHEKMNLIDLALKDVDVAINLAPDNSFILEQKGILYQKFGQTQKALNYYKSMHQKHPQVASISLYLAQLLYQQGDNQSAEKLLKKVVSDKPNQLYARYLYAVTLLANKKVNLSKKELIFLIQKKYKLGMVNYFLGSIFQNSKDFETALKYFSAVNSGQYLYQARINAANILYRQNKTEEALHQLQNVPVNNIGEQMALASNEIALLKDSGNLTQNMPRILSEFKNNPTKPYIFARALLSAQSSAARSGMIQLAFNNTHSYEKTKKLVEIAVSILSRKGDAEQSMQLLNGFLSRFPGDVSLRYIRAMQYASQNNMKSMELDLKYILREKPNYIDALNALGYSLADDNRELDKAYKMILTAFRARPGNAAITDSLGWILYRQGKLKEATLHLKQAWNLSPTADIGAHLGEVLWISGQKEKAQEYWKKSLQIDAKNKLLMDTIKKFRHE